MQKGLRRGIFVIVVLFLGWVAILNFKYCNLRESYQRLLSKEELTVFEFRTYHFTGKCVREISFSQGEKARTVRVDVTLQNSLDETVLPEYKIILYDDFGLVAGESTQNWIFSKLKPGETRKQDFNFSYDGSPKYVRLYDRTHLE